MSLYFEEDRMKLIIKENCRYFGLEDYVEIYRQPDIGIKYGISLKKEFDLKYNYQNPVEDSIKQVFQPMYNAFTESQWHKDIQEAHEKKIDVLKERIKMLEEQNMKLSEAFTNGVEFIEVDKE